MRVEDCPFGCQNGLVLIPATGTRVACPHCRGANKYLDIEQSRDTPNPLFEVLKIPVQYQNVTESTPYLTIDKIKVYPNGGVDAQEVANVLSDIVYGVEKGTLYRVSCYINVPPEIDMSEFVYGVQLDAVINEVGTMPYISANTLNFLLHNEVLGDLASEMTNETLASDGRTGKTVPLSRRLVDCTGFDYMDYINSPLIFIEATSGTTRQGWVAVADLLSERSKRGLPTYVIGYWAFSACGDGSYLETNSLGRMDRLLPVEIIPNQIIHSVTRDYSVSYTVPDNENENGVKVKGWRTPIDDADNV